MKSEKIINKNTNKKIRKKMVWISFCLASRRRVRKNKKRNFKSSFFSIPQIYLQNTIFLLVRTVNSLAPRVGLLIVEPIYSGIKKPKLFCFGLLAPRVGFEPTAYRLTVECSTAELSGNIKLTL